jgi:ribosomal protein S18 acetylase RimI-like enzyme
MMTFTSDPASDYSNAELVEILNRGFESYFVPIAFHVAAFLNMVRKDGIDLTSSRVLLKDDNPMGIALIARRGWTSRLAAMGIAKEYRGLGAGSWFMEHLIREAGQRGEREMLLEVIEQNEPAVHLYKKCGFEIMRRLIGLIRRDAVEDAEGQLEEIDIHTASNLITQYGLPDLPWQLSGESIAQTNPPARAYCKGSAYTVITNPEANDVVVWSLLVEPSTRGNERGADMLKSVIAKHPHKTWHIPALLPEELGIVYESAGFVREELSQWQMRLRL